MPPLTILGGAFALGVLAGFMLPVTAFEHRVIGPLRDRLYERARGTASGAVESGKQVLRDVVRGA